MLLSRKMMLDFKIPKRGLVLVKSELYKNAGYSCAVLTTADCCANTLASIYRFCLQSLQRGKNVHSVQCTRCSVKHSVA